MLWWIENSSNNLTISSIVCGTCLVKRYSCCLTGLKSHHKLFCFPLFMYIKITFGHIWYIWSFVLLFGLLRKSIHNVVFHNNIINSCVHLKSSIFVFFFHRKILLQSTLLITESNCFKHNRDYARKDYKRYKEKYVHLSLSVAQWKINTNY